MKNKIIILQFILISLILAGFVVGAFHGFRYFTTLVISLDKEIAAAIIATAGTILLGVVTVVYSQSRSKKREIAESHRPQKIAAYKTFMETIVYVLREAKEGDSFQDKEELPEKLQDLFFSFQSDLIVWGSPGVIQAYQKFKENPQASHILLTIDEILREIRKDLGNSNMLLKRGDLIKLFLRDPHELDKIVAKRA